MATFIIMIADVYHYGMIEHIGQTIGNLQKSQDDISNDIGNQSQNIYQNIS